ncbi:aminotransferase class I/II-fold pyridoxal phosphate-dependent enzyme [Ruegeria sp.]|uniref:aminotransferase class I/II-fold pyridoxal phosphate-dependent enzyme n=1 Tax=Ruegeria sp. TaxID=1879320 RepID=UPI0023151FA0|nr:aminotransferase class I/II-fold pyridoxal phosphate-dependent enzyme [Ruegeria sp.]MDA7965463.1 aminotransferase class I/II-fold pyridoxal phosphate-dependent enzyme [Ruegeria sp.]
MRYARMPIEIESPEQMGYDLIRYNLSESSVADRPLSDFDIQLDDTLLCYGDHLGDPELRNLIAGDTPGLTADHVLATTGAAGALFIIATSLLSKDDHLVVVRPNYATNIETPRAIGCGISYVDLEFDRGYALDLAQVEAAIRPNTRYVSVTSPHNPTGVVIPDDQMQALVALTQKHGVLLLVDETYREMRFGDIPQVAASHGDHVISVSSLSKTYGIPGIRTGWLITQNPVLMELFLAAKEQIGIAGSVVDEKIAVAALRQRETWRVENQARINAGFAIVKEWIETEPLIDWVEPAGSCICFPRISADAGIDPEAFYEVLFESYGTYVGPGHWFEQSDMQFRIGYTWPTQDALRKGLAGISAALRDPAVAARTAIAETAE